MIPLLDFESDVERLDAAIAALRSSDDDASDDILARIRDLEKEREKTLKRIYGKLSDWQVCQVARHPARPHANDYIAALCEDFVELRGDRLYADDPAIVAGLARFDGDPVAVVGHQKGRDTKENVERHFGMPNPEGYRKAMRVMRLAEKFSLPLLFFVDTPGAYPGIGAEERGQSGAIGECLRLSAELETPMLSAIIGEGGSGGALALAAGDWVGMLRHSIYSVISPEGCATILWKDKTRMADAAAALGLTAPKLKKLNFIDEVIDEPPGGAHRDPAAAQEAMREAMRAALARLRRLDGEKLLARRHQRFRDYGVFREA